MKVEKIREKMLEFLLDINECEDDEIEYVCRKLWEVAYEIEVNRGIGGTYEINRYSRNDE